MELIKNEVTVSTGSEKMPCHLARPAAGGPFPAIVVVMEAFGLNNHIRGVTDRFAAEGFVAIAPNLYFRQPKDTAAYDDLPTALGLMRSIRDEQVVADMAAVLDYVKGLKETKRGVGVVGYCMGGRIAFLTACRNPAITAAVPYYGGGMVSARMPGQTPPIEYVAGLRAPVLAFFGGKDQSIPIADVDKFRDELKRASKAAEIVLYADAQHGFMCDERPSYHPVHAREAWAKTVEFFRQHLA